MNISKMISLLLLVISLGFAGCGTLSLLEDTSNKLPIQYVTLKLIEGDAAKAAATIQITEAVLSSIDGNPLVTVGDLAATARGLIDFGSLDVADQLLANALLDGVEETLVDRLEGLEPNERVVALKTVIRWIQEAAEHVPDAS